MPNVAWHLGGIEVAKTAHLTPVPDTQGLVINAPSSWGPRIVRLKYQRIDS